MFPVWAWDFSGGKISNTSIELGQILKVLCHKWQLPGSSLLRKIIHWRHIRLILFSLETLLTLNTGKCLFWSFFQGVRILDKWNSMRKLKCVASTNKSKQFSRNASITTDSVLSPKSNLVVVRISKIDWNFQLARLETLMSRFSCTSFDKTFYFINLRN